MVVGLISCFLNYESVSCVEYIYGNLIFAIISGICISLFVVFISNIINNNAVFEYVGRNTMGILIFHKIIVLIFQSKFGLFTKLLLNSNLYIEIFLSFIIVIISVIFSLILNQILKKFFPFLVGEINRKNITK